MYFIAFIESVCRSNRGKVDNYITVVDVDGFGWGNMNMTLIREMMRMVV
jgi:hypothetical protein